MKTISTDNGVEEIVNKAKKTSKQTKSKKTKSKKPNGSAQKAGGTGQKAGVLVLDPANPMQTARTLKRMHFTSGKFFTLWRHRGCFWMWTDSYYRLVNDETIRAHIWPFLDKAYKRVLNKQTKQWDVVAFKPKTTNVTEIVNALTSVCQLDEHINPPVWLSSAATMPPVEELFTCGNGLLHLPTGKLYAATPDFFCLNASTVIYDAKAKAPQFDAFLVQLFEDDQTKEIDREAIKLLQDWYGYTLTPSTAQQKILGMFGPPRCGKGTLARLIFRLLGKSSVGGPTMHSLGEQFGLEPLITKSLAIVSDVRIGSHTDKSTIVERLLSISGEDTMTVGRKYNSAWTGKMPMRIMLLSNELLALTDGSGAFASRLMIALFTKSFLGKEDIGLTDKLAAELSGILNWAIEGYRRLTERGFFIQPQSAKEAAEAIAMLGAPVKAFVRDCCRVEVGLSVTVDDLYSAYREWCTEEGRSKDVGSKEWFGRNLHASIPNLRMIRPRVEGERERIYEGIALIEPPSVRRVQPAQTQPAQHDSGAQSAPKGSNAQPAPEKVKKTGVCF